MSVLPALSRMRYLRLFSSDKHELAPPSGSTSIAINALANMGSDKKDAKSSEEIKYFFMLVHIVPFLYKTTPTGVDVIF